MAHAHQGQYNRDELNKLFIKAQQFNQSGETRSIMYLYRDKYQDYFFDSSCVQRTDRCKMLRRQKDENGDPRSPLNRKTGGSLGLFFGANIDYHTGGPCLQSPYGNMRVCVPVSRFLNDQHKLYFTDFYCMKPGGPHYVTLVIAQIGSPDEAFCEGNLLRLNMHDNAFLFSNNVSGDCIRNTGMLWIEVFYLNDLDITEEIKHLTSVGLKHGVAVGGKEGIRKRPTCRVCNI